MKILLLLLFIAYAGAATAQTSPDSVYASYPSYTGTDLGLTYSGNTVRVRVWAPTADALTLRIYAQGMGGAARETHEMKKAEGGTWVLELSAMTQGFYSVQATIKGEKKAEVAEPYAHAVGLNGRRAAFVDPSFVSPPDWQNDKRPALKQATDIIIGELHVRDLSTSPNSGIVNKGKYIAFTETGTKGPKGVATGIDHLRELGLTHVHLLPTNDFASLDESPNPTGPLFNWGYDPLNYTVPEGSYATAAGDPKVRIREFKRMAQALHDNGIRLVLDVVYNHVSDAGSSAFEQLVPGYYFRHNANGSLSNASGCGNEVASERPMVRKLIVESVAYWAQQYHVDGFRFDLMGALDLETMRAVRKAVDAIDPSIFLYGEGWTAGGSPLSDKLRAIKANTHQLDRVAAFSDELRDGVKGHYARHEETGFAGGRPGLEESVKFGIVGATRHRQIDYTKVNASNAPWANQPGQCINYVACHDDMVLWDKINASTPGMTEEERVKVDLLSNTIVFTAQGVPFLPVGDEFLRTKFGVSNSYNKPDSINQFNWGLKAKNAAVFAYYKGLIAMRKAHPAFRLPTQELIEKHLEFLPSPNGTLAYRLKDNAGGDRWKTIYLMFNGTAAKATFSVPQGAYTVVLRDGKVSERGMGLMPVSDKPVEVPAHSALILAE